MQNISNLIAQTAHKEEERKLSGAYAAGAFVLVLLMGAAGAAVWMGSALSHLASAPVVLADETYQ